MTDYLVIVLLIVFFCFAFVVLFGAPYLPTLKPQVERAIKLTQLKPGQTMVELGSGDGRLLIAAAKQGVKSIGYEINPLLFAYSWLATRKYKKLVIVKMKNFWKEELPESDAIFTFLLQKYMTKLDNKIIQEARKPIILVSFAFEIPNKKPTKVDKGMFVYNYE